MNHSQKPAESGNKNPWLKIGLIVGVLVLVAIFSGRSGLEDLLGLEPGTLGGKVEQRDPVETDNNSVDTEKDSKTDSKTSSSASKEDSPKTQPRKKPFELKRNGFVMESPEGLTYYVGDRGENRIDHVMRHAKDQPNRRGSHGVFDGDKNEILTLLDEAYSMIKSNSRKVKQQRDRQIDSRVAYEVDMGRIIGYKGGQAGKSSGYPKLRVVKLILDKGNRVITAYPFR